MTNGLNWSLSDLIVNLNSNPVNRRSLIREESFVLAWIVFNRDNHNYRDLMRECNLTIAQCEAAIEGLIELDLLRLR